MRDAITVGLCCLCLGPMHALPGPATEPLPLPGAAPRLSADAAVAAELATELFNEQSWRACRLECMRAMSGRGYTIAFMRAVCELRLGFDSRAALNTIVTDGTPTDPIVQNAAFELGKAHWRDSRHADALRFFRYAFNHASSSELFARAGCSLFMLLRRHPESARNHRELHAQLRSCARLWNRRMRAECDLDTQRVRSSPWTLPARWAIALYRTQVGPAIGERCALEPSCSEYCRQALRRHGILALPMQADRFCREPSVVADKRSTIRRGNTVRYADPLSDHDWWMR